jgi:hypothetical protein
MSAVTITVLRLCEQFIARTRTGTVIENDKLIKHIIITFLATYSVEIQK